MKTALIVIDVQKFFIHDAPDDLVSKIVDHIEHTSYDAVAFTIFKNNPDSNFVKSLDWSKCLNTEDTQLPDAFSAYVTDTNVFTRAAYSGFTTTKLDDYLKQNDIDKVVLCGVDTDACVLATTFSAFDYGYLIDVNTDLTYSGGGLEKEAQAIMYRSLIARRFQK